MAEKREIDWAAAQPERAEIISGRFYSFEQFVSFDTDNRDCIKGP